MNKKISIVMTYFERPSQLKMTLNSFDFNKYGSDVEVIIVDDGSIEFPASSICGSHEFAIYNIYLDPQRKWYNNSCIPYNVGFQKATGDIIIIQNAECLHFDNIIKHASENLDENSYFSYSCYSLNQVDTINFQQKFDFSTAKSDFMFNEIQCKSDGETGWYNHVAHRPVAYHFCSAIYKNKLSEIKGFDERYAKGIGYDDDQLLYAIGRKKLKIRIIEDVKVIHQWHYTTKTKNSSKLISRNKLLYRFVTRLGMNYQLFSIIYSITTKLCCEKPVFKFISLVFKMVKIPSRIQKKTVYILQQGLSRIIKMLPPPDSRTIPIIINNRNRLSTLKNMIDWLLSIKHENIVILDNDSTYEPLLSYYKTLQEEKSVTVIYIGKNMGPYSLWITKYKNKYVKSFFAYTDSDLCPITSCPNNFMDLFLQTLLRNPKISKIGFGLEINDLPDHYIRKQAVLSVEKEYWINPTKDNSFFYAPIDTTFALYAPYQKSGTKLISLRANYPYILKHVPWYINSSCIDEEESYYINHADNSSSWNANFYKR